MRFIDNLMQWSAYFFVPPCTSDEAEEVTGTTNFRLDSTGRHCHDGLFPWRQVHATAALIAPALPPTTIIYLLQPHPFRLRQKHQRATWVAVHSSYCRHVGGMLCCSSVTCEYSGKLLCLEWYANRNARGLWIKQSAQRNETETKLFQTVSKLF